MSNDIKHIITSIDDLKSMMKNVVKKRELYLVVKNVKKDIGSNSKDIKAFKRINWFIVTTVFAFIIVAVLKLTMNNKI